MAVCYHEPVSPLSFECAVVFLADKRTFVDVPALEFAHGAPRRLEYRMQTHSAMIANYLVRALANAIQTHPSACQRNKA